MIFKIMSDPITRIELTAENESQVKELCSRFPEDTKVFIFDNRKLIDECEIGDIFNR